MCRNVPDAWAYCGKPETRLEGYEPFQLGQCPDVKAKGLTEQEKDELHIQAKAAMKRGCDEEWFEADPKRRRFFRGSGYQLKNDLCRRQEPSTEFTVPYVMWYIGPTGLGKTAAAAEYLKDVYYYMPTEDMRLFQFMDGYRGQKYMWIDDFDGWVNFRTLLKLLGGYQQRCNVKCSGTVSRIHTFIITSDTHPEKIKYGIDPDESKRHKLEPHQWAQLERRITALYEFVPGALNEPPWPPHPSNRAPQLIKLLNGLEVRPKAWTEPLPPVRASLPPSSSAQPPPPSAGREGVVSAAVPPSAASIAVSLDQPELLAAGSVAHRSASMLQVPLLGDQDEEAAAQRALEAFLLQPEA